MKKCKPEASITSPGLFLSHLQKARGFTLPEPTEFCFISHCESLLDQAMSRYRYQCFDIGARRKNEIYFFYPEAGNPFCMLTASAGAPMAAVLIEELIALGFGKFVATGTAGHPCTESVRSLQLGDFLLVDRALIYEGTSRYYEKTDEVSSDETLRSALARSLKQHELPYKKGPVATTDAIYRETPSFINELVGKGVMGIEMELSALFAVAEFHQKSAAGLVYISDLLAVQGEWGLGFAKQENLAVEKSIFNVLMGLV